MNRQLESMKEELIKDAEVILNKAKANTDYHYHSTSGKDVVETKGSYNPRLTHTVAKDIMSYGLFSKKYYLAEISIPVRCMNDTLMRRFDDRKAGREMIDFPWENTGEILSLISDAMNKIEDDKSGSGATEAGLLTELTKRVLKMMHWAYVQDELESQKWDRLNADKEVWDADGKVKLEGLSEEDKECVYASCRIRNMFLKALTELPVECPETKRCMDIIESASFICQITFSKENKKLEEFYHSGKLDKIDEFIKTKFPH